MKFENKEHKPAADATYPARYFIVRASSEKAQGITMTRMTISDMAKQ
jgi:hypothetical protein